MWAQLMDHMPDRPMMSSVARECCAKAPDGEKRSERVVMTTV